MGSSFPFFANSVRSTLYAFVSVTGSHKVDRRGTYKLFQGVTLVALLLEREAREAAAVRRLLSVEPYLGSAPAMIEFGKGLERLN